MQILLYYRNNFYWCSYKVEKPADAGEHNIEHMITPIKTIWKYGIVFSDSKEELDQFARNTDSKTKVWCGEIDRLPKKHADEVAEIHPNFEKYYEAAMMPLYKTYGKNKKGTEYSTYAIETLKSGKENEIDLPYVFIWKIME